MVMFNPDVVLNSFRLKKYHCGQYEMCTMSVVLVHNMFVIRIDYSNPSGLNCRCVSCMMDYSVIMNDV